MTGRVQRTLGSSRKCTPTRVEVLALDIDLEIERYNVPLATKPACDPKSQSASEEKLDFIGNCPKWADQALAGLFGPDLEYADFVLMAQMKKLRQNLPTSLIKRFPNTPSAGEVVFYYYRFHLALSRYSSNTRTLHSPKSRQKRIYPFFIAEYPNDPTDKLLSLSLINHNSEVHEDQGMGVPNVALVFELIRAIAAWAAQTNHTLAPSHEILKIILRTEGTESEFAFVRAQLARDNIHIFIPEKDMVEARGWIQLGGELKYEAIDDLEYSDEDDSREFVPFGFRTPYFGGKMQPRESTIIPHKDIYKGAGDHGQINSPSLFSLSEFGRTEKGKTKRNSFNQRQETNIQRFGTRINRPELQGPLSQSHPRLSTTQLKGQPVTPGGTSNYHMKMDQEFDKFWPNGQLQSSSVSWMGTTPSPNEPPQFASPADGYKYDMSGDEEDDIGFQPRRPCCTIS